MLTWAIYIQYIVLLLLLLSISILFYARDYCVSKVLNMTIFLPFFISTKMYLQVESEESKGELGL